MTIQFWEDIRYSKGTYEYCFNCTCTIITIILIHFPFFYPSQVFRLDIHKPITTWWMLLDLAILWSASLWRRWGWYRWRGISDGDIFFTGDSKKASWFALEDNVEAFPRFELLHPISSTQSLDPTGSESFCSDWIYQHCARHGSWSPSGQDCGCPKASHACEWCGILSVFLFWILT